MKSQSTLQKSTTILWLLALVSLLALVWLTAAAQPAHAERADALGITPTPTSPPTDTPPPPPTDTPAPQPTNTPKPHDDDDDDNVPPPPPPPTQTPLPSPTATAVIPSMLPATGGSASSPWAGIAALGAAMIIVAGLLFKGAQAKE